MLREKGATVRRSVSGSPDRSWVGWWLERAWPILCRKRSSIVVGSGPYARVPGSFQAAFFAGGPVLQEKVAGASGVLADRSLKRRKLGAAVNTPAGGRIIM